MSEFERFFGLILAFVVLADIYLTVLYARVGKGVFSHFLTCGMWRLFCVAARRSGRFKDVVLGYCGPTALVVNAAAWLTLLTVGSALINHPALGRSIRSTSGETSPHFSTALYIAGDGMTTAGATDYAPHSTLARLYFVVNSLVGISVLTLVITYYLQIYNALQRRNTLALKLHDATAGTGDAIQFIGGIGPGGQFSVGYSHLMELAAEVTGTRESLHFYSALFYFRFREPHYALARLALVSLDTVSLIKSGLDDERAAWLKESAAVEQIWRSSMQLVNMLADAFVPGSIDSRDPPAELVAQWRGRFDRGRTWMARSGLAVCGDGEQGAENYVALRSRWDRYVTALAAHMMNDMRDIDMPLHNQPIRDEPSSLQQRRHAPT